MKDKNSEKQAIAAISTAVGEAGISVIRISGFQIIEKFNLIWIGKNLSKTPSHTLHYGQIRNLLGEIIDDVVVSVFRNPTSFTGEDVLEVSCHGGFLNTRRVYETILSAEILPAQAGEFTQRAFLNGKIDLTQAEAVADIIHAQSDLELRQAGNQLSGVLGNKIRAFRQELIDTVALVELELDFVEEDVEFANKSTLKKLVIDLRNHITFLVQSYESGRLIKDGVKTAIIGLPNAGKSTLLNALLVQERAIVSPIAGTTRDTIEAAWSHGGLRFILVDTAGIRATVDIIEEMGVERSKNAISEADLVVLVLDGSDPEQTETQVLNQIGVAIKPHQTLISVVNKMDNTVESEGETTLLISAKNGLGLDRLKERMRSAVFGSSVIQTGGVTITSARHQHLLLQTNQALERTEMALDLGESGEFVSAELRRAIQHLGLITGQITNEDVLDSVFSRFCIGK
jgi:tRNA modification GTPase